MVLSGCRKEQQDVPELLTPVGVNMDTAVVKKVDLSKTQRYVGNITAESTEVWFKIDGIIESLEVSYGDEVQAGDVIARLNHENQDKQIEALELQIEHQKQLDEFENQRLQLQLDLSKNQLNELYANGVDWSGRRLAALDVEEKELAIQQAAEQQELRIAQLEESLETLKSHQDDHVLRAPVSGHIVYVNDKVMVGSPVSAYTPVYCITDESTLYAVTTETSENALKSAVRIYASIGDEQWDLENVPYSKDETLAMILAGNSMRTRFLVPEEAQIHLGDSVVIYVETKREEGVLTIPPNALYRDEAGSYVYVVENGARHRLSIETGLITETAVEVVDGLSEGDEVYVKE